MHYLLQYAVNIAIEQKRSINGIPLLNIRVIKIKAITFGYVYKLKFGPVKISFIYYYIISCFAYLFLR